MDRFNVDANIYSKESLRLLNIRDLRDIGRTFGVPSPTTKSKDELVEYILKILYGEVKGEVRNTRGRPNTRSFNMDKYVSAIKKRSIVKPGEFAYQTGEFDFSLKLAEPNTNHTNNSEILQRVFVKDDKGSFLRVHGFVESNDDIKVSGEIETKFNLENFDMVEIISAEGLFKIVSVNGKKVQYDLEKTQILGHTFVRGGFEVFHLSTNEEIESQITEISNLYKDKNIKMLLFADEHCYCEGVTKIGYRTFDDGINVYKKLIDTKKTINYALNLFLPRFLLFFKTLLPPLVFILALKPWTLLLCLFFGW